MRPLTDRQTYACKLCMLEKLKAASSVDCGRAAHLYLAVGAQLSERVQTLLQLCRHAARQLAALGDLPAEGAVVLHQTQDVAAVAVGPHAVARHQARGGAGDALALA